MDVSPLLIFFPHPLSQPIEIMVYTTHIRAEDYVENLYYNTWAEQNVNNQLSVKTCFCQKKWISLHCKQTRRKRSNSIYITVTTLWPPCSSISDLSHMSKKNKFIQLHLQNSKVFVLFNISSIKKVMIKSIYYFNVICILL